MGEGFVKLFSSILDSSVWCYDSETRLVWITLLAMADFEGVVHASVPGIANRARVSLEAAEKAIKIFQSPDEYSRSDTYEGRRIERVGRDWIILNYEEYRNKMSKEAERERKKKWWRENKGKGSKNDKKLDKTSASETLARPITEADTDSDNINYIVSNTMSDSSNCKVSNSHTIVHKTAVNEANEANKQSNLFVQSSDSQNFELKHEKRKILINDSPPKEFTDRQKAFLEALKKAEFYLRKSSKVKNRGPHGNVLGFYALKDPVEFARIIGDIDVYPLVKHIEIQKAANWTKINPKKAKVYPIDKFLLNWLDNSQGKACKNSIHKQNVYHNNNSYQNYHPSYKKIDSSNDIGKFRNYTADDLDPEIIRQLDQLSPEDK